MASDRKLLRQELRALRRSLAEKEQENIARTVAETILQQTDFPLGEHIALYLSADGEVGTRYLIDALWAQGKHCYLPVLVEATTTLEFRQYLPDNELITNFFGLLEPEPGALTIAPEKLTTVFVPLVGFDLSGNRLGMGKGYYDRTFAFMADKAANNSPGNTPAGPNFIGLAHECQRVESLEAADWDVPLGGIITGQHFYKAG